MITLEDRARVVAVVWPTQMSIAEKMWRCALVNDIHLGLGTPTVSQKDRERVTAEIAKIEARP
jgi:hypothetical protein